MKKSLFAFAALAAILAGCAKEITGVDSQDTVKVTLHATVPDTKVITDNAGAFTWQAGDKVTVLNTSGEAYEFSTKAGGTAVDFSSTTFDGDLSTEAMYPASASHASGKFYLNPSFDWVADASMMPMAGTVDTDNLTASFAPVGGVLKLICFNVDKDADNLVVSSDSKQIVGLFTPSAGKITAAASDENKAVTVSFAKAEAARTMVFYIPLPTGTLGKLTFTLNNGSTKVFEKTTKGDVSFDAAGKMIVAPGLNCANDLVMWSEDFSGYSTGNVPADTDIDGYGVNNITYVCANGGSDTKIYDANLAGGKSKELLVSKSGGSFTVSNLPTNGAGTLTLKYKTNAYTLNLSSTTDGVSFSSSSTNTKEEHAITITNSKNATSFNIIFSTGTSSNNVRLDDISLIIAGASFSAPAITPTESELAIAVGATTASTEFTYTNPVDEMPVVATVNDAAKTWLSAEISGSAPYTLTVKATGANTGAEDRAGTVTLRASGVSKAITVTQATNLVPNPTVAVTPADGKFSASWTADANATGYVAYLHTAETETPATGGTAIVPTVDECEYSITDYAVENGKYYLYVKVSTVAENYAAPSDYVMKSFTCEGTPKGTAADNPYTVAEAVAKWGEDGDTEDVYVKGILCTEGSSYCFISDDGTETDKFELYNISGSITSSDLKAGDAVIAHGTLKYYSTGNVYELSGTTVDVHISKPAFTPNGGNFVGSQSVAIASTNSSSIRYTTDGTVPTVSAGTEYSSALNLEATTTVKAVGIDANAVVCTAVASATFTKLQTYAVTWDAPSNGTITVKNGETTLASGDLVPETATVTITVSPADGYALSALTYNDGEEHDIKSAKSFTMPAHAVTIAATFEEIGGAATPLDAPANVALTAFSAAGFTATWTNDANADSYSWMLSTSNTAPASTGDASVKAYGTSSTATLKDGKWTLTKTGLSLDGVYYFYVKANGVGAYSDSDYASLKVSLVAFESASSSYSEWSFSNMTSQQSGSITAKNGTYYGTTGGKASAHLVTANKISSPKSLIFYVSKQSSNTTTSTWKVQVSSDGTTWTDVKSQSATSMNKGTWVEVTQSLTNYSKVYVRIYYNGSTAIRNIDDVSLICN